MAGPSNQDQVVEGNEFGVLNGARTGCERETVGVELITRVDAALALMELAKNDCPLHRNKLCTFREDSVANCMQGIGFSLVQSENMDSNVGKEGNLHETSWRSEGRKLIIKLPKKGQQHVEACSSNDVQNMSRLGESDYGKLLNEPLISPHAGFSDDVEVVPETKPSKMPRLSSVSFGDYMGFSFSIVHFLSAIRIAMITAHAQEENSAFGEHLWQGNIANSQMEKKMLPALSVHEIVERVRANPVDPSILRAQEPLEDLVRGALNIFSLKVEPEGACWKALALYMKSRKAWSWVGPVSSTDEATNEQVSAGAWGLSHRMFVKMVNCFADWLRSVQDTLKEIGSLPDPPYDSLQQAADLEEILGASVRQRKCVATISPCSEELRAYFHMEEVLRYSLPERAFTYTAIDGRKSTVAPLRSSVRQSSRVRDHVLLKAVRPSHVTILSLVRDAAARLPARRGTRADICILLRESQYIIENITENQINQVVSRALDRLHYENDPCIKFDSDKRVWCYLHGDKEEEDFCG